jgi:hypothetical protein
MPGDEPVEPPTAAEPVVAAGPSPEELAEIARVDAEAKARDAEIARLAAEAKFAGEENPYKEPKSHGDER